MTSLLLITAVEASEGRFEFGFGAGFGGSVFAIIEARNTDQFLNAWADWYRREYPEQAKAASFFAAVPSDGVQDWSAPIPSRWIDQVFR